MGKECPCRNDKTCPSCHLSYDLAGISYDIDGDLWHVHNCPFCGIYFGTTDGKYKFELNY